MTSRLAQTKLKELLIENFSLPDDTFEIARFFEKKLSNDDVRDHKNQPILYKTIVSWLTDTRIPGPMVKPLAQAAELTPQQFDDFMVACYPALSPEYIPPYGDIYQRRASAQFEAFLELAGLACADFAKSVNELAEKQGIEKISTNCAATWRNNKPVATRTAKTAYDPELLGISVEVLGLHQEGMEKYKADFMETVKNASNSYLVESALPTYRGQVAAKKSKKHERGA